MSVPPALPKAGFTGRGGILLALTAVVGALAFTWPLVWRPGSVGGWVGVVLLVACVPLALGVVAAELANHSLDVKALAMLGVLSAVGAVVRPLGAGTAGIETLFFLLVVAGRVFGPGFGFVLGTTSLFASALLTGGIGVWLPYQMLAAAFVGFGAGVLPRVPRWGEVPLLCAYGAVSAFVFGSLMDLSFWPFALGAGGELSYDAGASGWVNLHRFAVYEAVTGTGWNLGRAITTVVLLVVLGRPMLHVLRRAARRASFTG